MIIFERIIEWLWIIVGVLFLGVIGYLGAMALSLKSAAMRNAKRLYEPPLNSVKSLIGTGKGIVQREQVRVQHILSNAKIIAGDVKETTGQVGGAAKTVHPDELKDALANAQKTFQFVTMLTKIVHGMSNQHQTPANSRATHSA